MIRWLRKKVRGGLAAIGREVVHSAALCLYQRPEPECAGLEIHTLASRKTFDSALLAFASLEFHSGKRWRFVLHDDGTLGEAECRQLQRIFADARLVRRAEADRQAHEALAGFPRCLAHRARHNLALKFFDTLLFARTSRWILLDSDVIFFREPVELVRWAEQEEELCLYNEDTREKFCLPRRMIESRFACRMPPRFNSGLVLHPGPGLPFERAEAFLAEFEKEAHAPQFIEQTLWAISAGEARGGARPLPRTYNVSWGYWREKGSIARHYVGEFKHDLLYIEGSTHMLGSVLTHRRSQPHSNL